MKKMMSFLRNLVIVGILLALVWTVAVNYSLIFAKRVEGKITAVERDGTPVTLMLQPGVNSEVPGQASHFVIGIREKTSGTIFIASSDDHQWAIARPEQCAEAEFLPYPPWDLSHRGTYISARLLKLYDCP